MPGEKYFFAGREEVIWNGEEISRYDEAGTGSEES